MSSSRPATPRTDRRQQQGRRHLHRSSGIHLPSLSPKVQHYPIDADHLPMDSSEIVEKFTDIAQSMESLDNNMNDLSRIHDCLSNKFNESFASFLYGLSMTMWCVDFPGCPSRVEWENLIAKRERKERIKRLRQRVEDAQILNDRLKETLAEQTKQTPPAAAVSSTKPTRPVVTRVNRPIKSVNFKPSLNESTLSSITNDRRPVFTGVKQSQQASRIPQPGRLNRQIPLHQYQASNSIVPNLNQPPRYMRGLFDGTNTSNSQNYGRVRKRMTQTKPSSIANRPPFR